MPKFINGPVNYVQLNGNINNIDKKITIFLDKHLDINNQTRCESSDSIDISHYLYNMIKDAENPLDFFMEIRDEQLQIPITNKRDIYIKDIIEMFKTEFIIEKDKVKYSKSNQNVRLHYLDIRDHLELFYITSQINYEIMPKLNLLKNSKMTNDEKINKINDINKSLELIKKYMNRLNDNIDKIRQNQIKTIDKKTQEYYLNKIINEYNNEKIKLYINDFIEYQNIDNLSEYNKILLKIHRTIFYYKSKLDNTEIVNEIILFFNSLSDIITDIYTLYTDVYFLRRFLDKNYIKNAITYCGRQHAINYIYFLVKYCKFNITKIYNSNDLSIDYIMDKINETSDLRKVYNLFLTKGEKPIQCIDYLYLSQEDVLIQSDKKWYK
jgi:hypothetical protein